MFRNYLAAALRNLARNRLYAFISIACLAVGLAATFLAVAYLDHLHSYNRWIAGYQHVYRVSMEYTLPGAAPVELATTPQDVIPWVALNVAHVLHSARIDVVRGAIRHESIEAFEHIAWADEDVFKVLPLPVYLGDLDAALRRPDALVLTRSIACKYFGTDQALGRTLEINREHSLTVAAVIEDLPPNTRLFGDQDIGVFASGSAPFSPLNLNPIPWSAFGYVRVDAGASVEGLNAQLLRYRREGASVEVRLIAMPLDQLVYSRDRRAVLYAVPALAALVLLISCMNFVNLTTARSIRRSTEVGVRKAAGASRWDLIAQFMGEALVFSALGMVLALSLCELSLPIARNLLDVPMSFEYWHNPTLMAAIVAITLVTALLSGFYPAVLLARLNPSSILNGGKSQTGQSRGLRRSLVIVQFSVLAALVVGVIVAGEQIDHLLSKTLRFDGERMLMIQSTCRRAFVDELRKLPGVAGIACSEAAPLDWVTNNRVAKRADGVPQAFEALRVDAGFLELYGLRPVAGRFFSADRVSDFVVVSEPNRTERIVINTAAVRNFGFDSAQAAIGRDPFPGADFSHEVIGVVEDFRLGRFDQPMGPMVYVAEPARGQLLSVKLRGDRVPETLERIDVLWRQLGDPKPIHRFFLSGAIEAMHRAVVRQRSMFGIFAVLAVSLAIVGMLGLASSAAEERRLEIGVRKAFGAGMREILQLVLWPFLKLSAAAGLIGCLVALPLMHRWLEGFEDRIDLQPWMFVGTCALLVCLAVLTVCGHAVLMARARPILALRCE